MARIIKHTSNSPYQIEPSDKSTFVCMCGLSNNYPFCDGAHKLAKNQEADAQLYLYDGETAQPIDDIETKTV